MQEEVCHLQTKPEEYGRESGVRSHGEVESTRREIEKVGV